MQEIVICKDNYGNDREKMYNAIAKQIALLMENEYVCKVYDDDTDIIVIQFEHDNKKDDWGGEYLFWLTEEEVNLIERYREKDEPQTPNYDIDEDDTSEADLELDEIPKKIK